MSGLFAIEARTVSVRLGKARVLDQASVGFRPGEVAAIVGPNGAGKTTLLKALLRLVALEAGEIHLLGEDISGAKPHQLAGRVGYLEQSPTIHWPLSVEALVSLGLKPGQSQGTALESALERTAVSAFRKRSVLALSGGEQSRVLLARVLASDAPVILADEPTLSLDPRHQIAILECFRAQAKDGRCVVLVMHDLLMAEKYADRIVVMDQGRVCKDDRPERALDAQTLHEIFGIDRAALA